MRRTVYFAFDAIWSFILATIIWYTMLYNSSFDFYHNSDNSLAGMIFVAGMVLFVLLTIAYIIIGFKTVQGWRWWMSIIVILITAAMYFAGLIGAVYGSELISGNLGV